MKRLWTLTVIAAVLTAVSATAGAATPAKLKTGTFVSIGDANQMQLEIVKRDGSLRVRLLKIADRCTATSLTSPPVGLGKVRQRAFHSERLGYSNTFSTRLTIDGQVVAPNRIAVQVEYFATAHATPDQPVPASCTDNASFTLKRLRDGL